MPILTFFSSSCSHEDDIIKSVISSTAFKWANEEILEQMRKRFGVTAEKILDTGRGKISLFNNFTREREKTLLFIQSVLSDILNRDKLVISGFFSHLVPLNISHVLKVCLAAPLEYRVQSALQNNLFSSEKEALKQLKEDDFQIARWTNELRGKGPLDTSLYDIKLPMQETSVEEAVSIIMENAGKKAVQTSISSRQAVDDFKLAMEVRIALMEAGHLDVSAESRNGTIVITIHKKVLRMEQLSRELESIGRRVKGVSEISVVAGPEAVQADIYRKQDFEIPKKVLLVDDEQDFVRTLSERLQMREFGTAVAFSGEDALSMAKEDMPEVMLLDLRMPGIDGLEVLRKLKEDSPRIEVIILTGHGSDKDRAMAMALGAFAYLEKPADIDKISETMKQAYDKIRRGPPPPMSGN